MLNIKKIKPTFTALITTMDKYTDDQVIDNVSSIIDIKKAKGQLKEYQTVVAVGSLVRDIKVGDLVCINPQNYAVRKHQEGSLKDGIITDNPTTGYKFNLVTIDNKDYLLLQDRDISYIIEDYEETSEPIITTEDKKIIV